MKWKSNTKIFLVVYGVLFIWHVGTLPISPLPWFDEVFFADVANSFAKTGDLNLTIAPQYSTERVVHYGPVYFILQVLPIKLLGLTPFVFRLLNLLSGLLIIYLLFRYLRLDFWLLALILFSPLYIQSLHSGRMDLVAVLFCLLGYIPFLQGNPISIKNIVFLSLCFILAALTTPRVVLLFPGVYVVFLDHYLRGYNNIGKLLLTGLTPALSVTTAILMWSLYSTGTLFGMITGIMEDTTRASHVGVSFFRGHLEDMLTLVLLASFFISVFHKKRDIFLWVAMVNYVFFSLFVKEVGPYGAMILPFILLGLKDSIARFKITSYANAAILMVFVAAFLLKNYVVLGSFSQRDGRGINDFIVKNISSGTTVVAPFTFYYGLMSNANQPITFQVSRKPERETRTIILAQEPKYLLIHPQDTSKQLIANLIQEGQFKFTAAYQPKRTITFSAIPIIGSRLKVTDGYDALLYKRAGFDIIKQR